MSMEGALPEVTVVTGQLLSAGARYLLLAGGVYWLLYVRFRRLLAARHIQAEFPSRAELWYQVRWSAVTLVATALLTVFVYRLIDGGWTRMYFDIGERGWPYFLLSILLGIIGYDTFIYWQHRILHLRWWYERIHYVHHRTSNPTPLALFTFHPVEHLMGNAYYLLLILLLPMHPLAFASVLVFFTGYAIVGHSGYELFPSGFTRHRLLGWLNTSTHHNMHHTHEGCNYGNWFNLWDSLMGTNHPDYHEIFESIQERAG